MNALSSIAWMEIDLGKYRRNLAAIWAHKRVATAVALVVKDDAYGHGAVELARVAQEFGPAFLAVASVREGVELREGGIETPILVLGERVPEEVEWCVARGLTPCVGTFEMLRTFAAAGRDLSIHIKIDTGMSRYGLRRTQWDEARAILTSAGLRVEGMLSHFAQSDEVDKTFANRQLAVFREAVERFSSGGIVPRYLHISNSGGFLDLPQAHLDLVRVGIIAAGIYPSKVCARTPKVEPVMSVRARIVTLKEIEPGDHVGYGMRFTAGRRTRVAVLPIGYGSGYPRVRNEGFALVRGKRAAIVGGVSMDAITIDVTDIPEAKLWDTATLLGRDGGEEIDIHELAALKKSVSYDVAVSWQRLAKVHVP